MKNNNSQTNLGNVRLGASSSLKSEDVSVSGHMPEKGINEVTDNPCVPGDRLRALITEFSPCNTTVSIRQFIDRAAEIRQFADQLDQIAESYAQELELLNRRKASAAAEFDRLQAAQWLTGPSVLDDLVAVTANPSLDDCSESYRQANAALSEINSCCDRLDEAARRLRRTIEVVVDLRNCSLEDAALQLIQRVKEFDDDLSQINQQEGEIAEVLDLVSELTPVESAAALEDTTPEIRTALFSYVAHGQPFTENGQRFEHVCRNPTLAGQLLRFAWPSDPNDVDDFLKRIAPAFVQSDLPATSQLISFLNVGQIHDLLLVVPESFATIGCLLLRDAIVYDRPTNLLLTLPARCKQVSTYCTALFEEFQHAAQRQQFPHAAAALRAYSPGTTSSADSSGKQLKTDLVDYLQRNPGLTKHYHVLRLTAQQHFLKPIRKIIEADEFEKALRTWNEAGNLDRKLEETIQLSEIHRGIVGSHRDQTRNYLETFEVKLVAWVEFRRNTHNWHGVELSQVLNRISQDSGELTQDWWRALKSCVGDDIDSLGNAPLGESCALRDGELVLHDADGLITPFLPLTWMASCGSMPLKYGNFLTDCLRISLGRKAKSQDEVVHYFVEQGAFVAAQNAAEEFEAEQLLVFATNAAAERRREIEDRNKAIIEEAQEARSQDEYVDLQMVDIEDAFDFLRFDEACHHIEQLDDLLADFRNRRTPEYDRNVKFLSTLGETVSYGETPEVLERRVTEIRQQNADRREHLESLSTFCRHYGLPEDVVSKYQRLISDYDLPSFWPLDLDSLSLASAIVDVTKYLTSRLAYGGDSITESLPYWMLNQIEACFKCPAENRSEVIAAFVQIAEDLARPGFPEQRLKDVLGVGGTIQYAAVTNTEVKPSPQHLSKSRATYQAPDANVVVNELRNWLAGHIKSESSSKGSLSEFRTSMRNCDWPRARQCAAAVAIAEAGEMNGSCLNAGEAAYAMCLALEPGDASELERDSTLSQACLAIACCDRTDIRQALPSDYIPHFVGVCFARLASNSTAAISDKKLPEDVAGAMSRVAAMDESGLEYVRVATLLAKANRVVFNELDGCAFLAETLWEVIKGIKDTSRPRSDLLIFLFRLRRYEAIQHLVQQAAAGMQDEIRSCLQVVQRLSADPSLYQTAAQRFLALRERSSGKTNTRPWVRFFEQLLSFTRQPEEPLTIGLESEFVVPDSDGNLLIEIELRPSAIDPPQDLILEVSDPAVRLNLLEGEHDFLTGSRVITVTIPKGAVQEAGNEARIAYKIYGRTLLDRRIDVRSVWELPVSRQRFEPIDPMRMKRSWPGSLGDPVQGERGFHGRTKEIERIEGYLMDPVRPRSAMLYGQRRIGKTSLLLQMIQNFPPQTGHVCGVFVDLQGLHISNQPGAMQSALFQKIVRDIETKDCNEAVHQSITGACGKKLSRLTSGIEPQFSLSGAIEELVRQIDEATNGKIKRMAFFIDEFDRFVEPMLTGRAEEVETLLWSLRPLVQQSEKISLIFAGSGLQRVFTGKYKQAFYGSIDEMEIGTFKLDSDHSAIENTFLPAAVSSDLCSDTHRKRVVERAFKLTGGHPYFLAMLGYSSAQIANGHMLTPALLNRVVEKMIRGDVMGVSCQKFYYHIFESLKYVPLEQQLAAQIILCRIALQTTAEHPWVQRMEAIGDPSLLATKKSTQLDILRLLANESAIENDDTHARVRIRVPITAAALRHDGERLKQEAILQQDELRIDRL